MRWNDYVMALRFVDERRLARLMALMWKAAADRADAAVLSNLQMNTLDCLGVANVLDYGGVEVPDGVHQALQMEDMQEPSNPVVRRERLSPVFR